MKRRPLPTVWLAVPLLLLFFFLAINSMVCDSPTMDEQNHLARGLAFLETGDPRLSLEHPPLVNVLSALPVWALLDVRLPTDHPSWSRPGGWYEFAELTLWEYNQDVTRMIFLARLPIVFLTLGLGVVGLRFARALWRKNWNTEGAEGGTEGRGEETEGWFLGIGKPGRVAGLLALFFLLFDPNILAHGRYTTTDVGGTLFVFLAAFLLWRLWQAEGWQWRRWLAAALGLGLAFGSKLSTLGFVPIFAVLAVLPLYGDAWAWPPAGRRLLQFLTAGLASIVVVWAIFGFQWAPFAFQGDALAGLNAVGGPMPTYWAGIEQILSLSGGGRPTFLLGQTSTDGFLFYFPVAFLVKTPLPTLFLLLLGSAVFLTAERAEGAEGNGEKALRSSRPLRLNAVRRRALFALLPAGGYFLLSLTSDLNIGYRHLLPMLPFLYLFIAGAVTHVTVSAATTARQTIRNASYLLLPILLFGTLTIHPHYLSFFNWAAGGPENGANILVDSNIDWGQDLLRLRAWMRENDVEKVKLAWFGTARPGYYGIDYDPLPGLPYHFDLWWDLPFNPDDPDPGIYAISASNLWELPLQEEKYAFPWFRARRPDDRVGYSIFIYEVE